MPLLPSSPASLRALSRPYLRIPMPLPHTQILCRLSHPNVVNIIGGCLRPPRIFVVSELMAGTLSGLLHLGPGRLPLGAVLLLALDVSRGLQYLHSLSVVHRDLKVRLASLRSSWTDRR